MSDGRIPLTKPQRHLGAALWWSFGTLGSLLRFGSALDHNRWGLCAFWLFCALGNMWLADTAWRKWDQS